MLAGAVPQTVVTVVAVYVIVPAGAVPQIVVTAVAIDVTVPAPSAGTPQPAEGAAQEEGLGGYMLPDGLWAVAMEAEAQSAMALVRMVNFIVEIFVVGCGD